MNTARARALITLALVTTLFFGLYLRWFLAGQYSLIGEFAHLRHAHSHLGYFGVLFPLSWAAWASVGAPIPGRKLMAFYTFANVLCVFGFVRAGYGVEAIVGSTIIGGIWLISAWPLRDRITHWWDLLGGMPLSVATSLACVPPIAFFLRRDAELSHAFIATFLSALLLSVIVPSALASRKIRLAPWPVVWLTATLGSAAMGVWPHALSRTGLFLYGALLFSVALKPVQSHLRVGWGAVAVGLMAVAVGLLPNNRPVAIGATHFLILGPVLATLAPLWLRTAPQALGWLVVYGCVGLLAGPLVLQGLGAGSWTMQASAVGGTLTVIWWLYSLVNSQESS